MTEFRIGERTEFPGGSAIPLLIDGKPRVCESTKTHDHTTDPTEARTKGQALIAAADQAEKMATDPDRS